LTLELKQIVTSVMTDVCGYYYMIPFQISVPQLCNFCQFFTLQIYYKYWKPNIKKAQTPNITSKNRMQFCRYGSFYMRNIIKGKVESTIE